MYLSTPQVGAWLKSQTKREKSSKRSIKKHKTNHSKKRPTNSDLLTVFRGSIKQRYAQKLAHKTERVFKAKYEKIKRLSTSPYKNNKDSQQLNIKRNASQSSVSGQNAMLNNCLDQDNKNEISHFEVNTIDRRVAQIQDKNILKICGTEDLSSDCKLNRKGDKKIVPSLIK